MDEKAFTPPGSLLTEAEAAAWLKVQIFTLRKWRREGRGPRFIRCGRRLIRYMDTDLCGWMEGHRYSSTANELSGNISK
jgi:hypothetical protein